MASIAGRPWIPRLVTLAVIIALVSPVVRDRDGLPLSTYPMYAGARSNVADIVTASGVTASGEPSPLSIQEIADTWDPLVAQGYLNDAVGRGDVPAVCAAIAARTSPPVVEVEVATERHDVVARVRGDPSMLDRSIHHSCVVPQ